MNKLNLLTAGAVLVIATQSAMAATVLFDDFDGTDLAAGDVGSINGGFQLVTNTGNGTGTVGESTGNATILTAANSFNTSGIVSINSFDASAATSISATWEVAGRSTAVRGTEFLLQSGTGFRAASYLQFSLSNTDAWSFNGSDGTVNTLSSSATALEGVADGFTLTLDLNATGWGITTTGLTTNISTSGAWAAGFDFTDLQTDLYAAAMVQTPNGATRFLDIDSISVATVPEPSTYALLAGLLGLSYVMVRRRKA